MRNRLAKKTLVMWLLVFVIIPLGTAAPAKRINLVEIEKSRVLYDAKKYLKEKPETITSFHSNRSAGGIHDYFSEGDYWWPDPKNPDGPYIQRDGETNPDNFVEHRLALLRFSVRASTLATAYLITHEEKYAKQAIRHFRSWFVDSSTRMNPHLKYAQAIKGKVTGRGIGIIDTIHLIEIAKAIEALQHSSSWSAKEIEEVKQWFRDYPEWMTTHEYGIAEREAKNNHGTCWVFQVAAYARLLGDTATMEFCRKRFKETLLPNQMENDGSFPLELKRTKPYSYSLFNLEAFAGICQLLSTPEDNLWLFTLPDGRTMKRALEFMYPFIKDKAQWKYPPDVMYYEYWPMRQASLLFGGFAFQEQRYLDFWKTLNPDASEYEIIRNYPIRQPLLWVEDNENPPSVFLYHASKLLDYRKRYRQSNPKKNRELRALLSSAEKTLKITPVSVVEKKELPPSGDKHDYLSIAPYWWPDSTKPEGSPYIRRDGERNPERNTIGDRKNVGVMIKSVETLALAYYITNEERYAEHASRMLRVWFLDSATRMNPHLKYAQAIKGRNEGRGSGIIDTYGFTELIDALQLLAFSESWTENDDRSIKHWFQEYLRWLQESENGKKEAEAKNNHGTTYAVQATMIALFLNKDSLAKKIIIASGEKRIASQIEPDGTEPFELVRTKSWGYSILNLEALMHLALLGERFGIDLWRFATDDGRSIKKSIDWLAPYAIGKKRWEHKQIVPMEKELLYPLLRVAAQKYNEPNYHEYADRILGNKSKQFKILLTLP